jgi:hypothetical protein
MGNVVMSVSVEKPFVVFSIPSGKPFANAMKRIFPDWCKSFGNSHLLAWRRDMLRCTS